jgi:hypothetical protein
VRIRQVKPSFWSDSKLAELPEGTRLFYIGLWMLADDAGWLRWDAPEAAKELYGYEPRHRREKRTAVMLEALTGAGRVIVHACGHLEIPRLTAHQRLAGPEKQVRTVYREHQRCIETANTRSAPQAPAGARSSPARNGNGKGTSYGDGKVSEGKVERAQDEISEFRQKVPRPGATA